MKPVIGVMPLWDEQKQSLWMLPGYLDGIRTAGGVPLILPFTEDREELEQLAALCSGFLFTGGQDVSPSLYGEAQLPQTVDTCPARDHMEGICLELALREKKPVLGICRGIQFINAAMGGTLYQHLPLQHPSNTEHHGTPPYSTPVHNVTVLPDTPLRALLGKETLAVNSYHHQAVKDCAPRLVPMAVSEDGLVEAVYLPEHPFLWAVQWHPEFSYREDPCARAVFSAFVRACGGEC